MATPGSQTLAMGKGLYLVIGSVDRLIGHWTLLDSIIENPATWPSLINTLHPQAWGEKFPEIFGGMLLPSLPSAICTTFPGKDS